MTKINKWVYLWVVQGDYGQGWEDLTQCETRRWASLDLRSYEDNDTDYHHRMIQP